MYYFITIQTEKEETTEDIFSYKDTDTKEAEELENKYILDFEEFNEQNI